MRIGVLVSLRAQMAEELQRVRSLDISSCQICSWNMALMADRTVAAATRAALAQSGVSVSSLWCGWSGPARWNFTEGPQTLGLVPEAFRAQRVADLKAGSDFAAELGVTQMATHMGFIPETACDPLYAPTIEAIRAVAEHCRGNGQTLLFETGQETPTTMIRAFEDIGLPNLGVNLDPANLLMYGKANPVDALDLIGPFVRDTHCKDGEYPVNGRELGVEKRMGQGRVGFEALVQKLSRYGYDGALTIEREISGDEQTRDIRAAKIILEEIINNLQS